MAVGELGFGSVTEGGSFIALPAEPSEEIKLENGQGVLPSSKLSSRQASVSSMEKDKAEERDTLAELPVGGERIVDADPAAIADGVVKVSDLAAMAEDAFGQSSSMMESSEMPESSAEVVTVSGGKIGAASITSSMLDEERAKYAELKQQYDENINNHHDEVERLQALISDLSRRLQNATHTVEATRKMATNASDTTTRFRYHIGQVSNALRLETAKNATNQRKKVHAEEAARYELNKKKAIKAHEDVRMAILDHSMTGMSRPTQKIIKMKKSITKMEQEHESQKALLAHLTQLDKMTEELTEAAQMGDLATVLKCLKKGVSANEIDSAGYLPLHYACSNGHSAIAKLLLEYGADPSSYLTGHSPIEMAAREGYTDIVKTILHFGGSTEDTGLRGATALVSAAQGNHIETVVALLNSGADIQGKNLEENTPLHVVTGLDNPVPLIRLLLKKGADITSINRDGHTPVRMAIANANALAVDALGGRAAMVAVSDDEPIGDNSIVGGGEVSQGGGGGSVSLRGGGSGRDEGSIVSAITGIGGNPKK